MLVKIKPSLRANTQLYSGKWVLASRALLTTDMGRGHGAHKRAIHQALLELDAADSLVLRARQTPVQHIKVTLCKDPPHKLSIASERVCRKISLTLKNICALLLVSGKIALRQGALHFENRA